MILASLKNGAKNGKEIITELNTEFGFFWQAKTSMVYPALRKLNKYGLIRKIEEESDDKTSSSTFYGLTEKGLQKLKKFRRSFNPPLSFFRDRKFKPPLSPFKRFYFWEKFVEVDVIKEQLLSYRDYLIKELSRIDKKIRELKEKEDYKEKFYDIDIR